ASRVPDRLELTERPDQLLAVHRGQVLRPRPAVAVPAGQRAAVLHHQLGPRRHEAPEGRDATAGPQTEIQPDAQAAFAEVAVHDAFQAELVEQLVEITQVAAEVLRRNRGVLPAGPGQHAVDRAGGQTRAVRPDLPHRAPHV